MHAYELGTLADSERTEFELHLFECEFCYENVQKFKNEGKTLRHDTDIRALSSEAVESAGDRKSRRTIIGALIAAATVIAVAVPTFLWYSQPSEVQLLRLLPLRGVPVNEIQLDSGGDIEIRFVLEGANEATSSHLQITADNGEILWEESGFDDYTERGLGTIQLPVAAFSPGGYTLTISEVSTKKPLPLVEYRFLAK
jgi:hypothetical protein